MSSSDGFSHYAADSFGDCVDTLFLSGYTTAKKFVYRYEQKSFAIFQGTFFL